MKKFLSLLLLLCLLLGALTIAQAETVGNGGLGEVFEGKQPTATAGNLGKMFEEAGCTAPPTPSPAPGSTAAPTRAPTAAPEPTPGPAQKVPSALFDEGVRDITCSLTGNQVDYAQIDGWIIRRAYLSGQDFYGLVGQKPDGATETITDWMPAYLVPAGDAFLYYGMDTRGKLDWLMQKPGEEPENLDLRADEEVLCADEGHIWCFASDGEAFSLRRLSRKTNDREDLGTITGYPVTMQEDGGILAFDYNNNRVESWKDGKATTLYAPEDLIFSVSSIGKNIWVEQEHEFGLLEDGKLSWRLPGNIALMAGTTDQFVFLLSFPGSDEYDVILFNEQYRAYVRVGYVPASKEAFVEFLPNRQLTVWGPEESITFDIPQADQWIPYDYYDVESARIAMGSENAASAEPVPTSEPDGEDMITVIVPEWPYLAEEMRALSDLRESGLYQYTENSDGSTTYVLTKEQRRALNEAITEELRGELDKAVADEEYGRAILSYEFNQDLSKITMVIDAEMMERTDAMMYVEYIGYNAPLVQLFEGVEDPTTTIELQNSWSDDVFTYTGPYDFWEPYEGGTEK